MVIRRTRALFASVLALALLLIVSMAAAGTADARTHAASAWMQWNAKSQSTVQPTREVGTVARHPEAAPFTAAEAFRHTRSAPVAATVPATPRSTAAGAPLTLYPARAPPVLL